MLADKTQHRNPVASVSHPTPINGTAIIKKAANSFFRGANSTLHQVTKKHILSDSTWRGTSQLTTWKRNQVSESATEAGLRLKKNMRRSEQLSGYPLPFPCLD